MLKVVLDTNIIVSATISAKSYPGKILELWRKDKFEIIITPAIFEETSKVLFRPTIKKYRNISDSDVQDLLIELQDGANLILPTQNIKVIDKDPDDDKFIFAAIEGQADYIVSGDKHLLDLRFYKKVKIVSPKEFVDFFRAQ